MPNCVNMLNFLIIPVWMEKLDDLQTYVDICYVDVLNAYFFVDFLN